MKRSLPLLLLAVLVAGCSGTSDVAATVNGVDIEAETIRSLVVSPTDELTDQQFLDALTAVVQWRAIGDAAEADFAISPTEEEVAAYADQIFAAQGAGMAREEFLRTQQVSEEGFALYAGQLLIGVLAAMVRKLPFSSRCG